jgi:hypothetical protein
MKKQLFYFIFCFFSLSLFGQNAIQLGAGSYAEYPPESVWDEDGYFAKNYRWFKR